MATPSAAFQGAAVQVINIDPYLVATGDPVVLAPALTALFEEIVKRGVQYSQEEAPEVTGRLRKSIKGRITHVGRAGPDEAQITQDERTYWGNIVLRGSPPHVILPRNKKALFWNGLPKPVMRVNHPGQKANPFFDRAANRLESDLAGPLAAEFLSNVDSVWHALTGD